MKAIFFSQRDSYAVLILQRLTQLGFQDSAVYHNLPLLCLALSGCIQFAVMLVNVIFMSKCLGGMIADS